MLLLKRILLNCFIISIASELTVVFAGKSICNPNININELPANAITTNTMLANNIVQYLLVNATNVQECAQTCCNKINCNIAFFKEAKYCFLITCLTEESCTPSANTHKSQTDPVDYMIYLRSLEESKLELETYLIKHEHHDEFSNENLKKSAINSYPKCNPNSDFLTSCPINELCLLVDDMSQLYECVCLEQKKFFKIDNVCREFLQPSQSCDLYMSECRKDLNEECVSLNEYAKHGTCQCKAGFKRNFDTFMCESFDLKTYLAGANKMENYNEESDQFVHRRKRPPLDSSETNTKSNNITESIDPLWENFLKELGIKNKHQENRNRKEKENANVDKSTNIIFPVTESISLNSQQTTSTINESSTTSTTTTGTTTTTTTTTTPSTTTQVTDAPDLFTDDLLANAGSDFHVYYPSNVCILNGTKTKFYTSTSNKKITKWLWTKMDSSPAFGRFSGSNELPIVVFENLEVGLYRFLLQVWTNTNDFSQDTVHVHVHSSLNNKPFSKEESYSLTDEMDIQDSLIQIELDIDPVCFTEIKKQSFLKNFQEYLLNTEFKLKQPSLILVSTKISTKLKKSNVLVELLVVENEFNDSNGSAIINLANNFVLKENQKLVKTSNLIKALRSKQEKPSILSLLLLPLTNNDIATSPYESLDFLGISVHDIVQPTCNTQKYTRGFNCSSHGKCDKFSHKCICDKYWMPNLYMYYMENKSDLTNGSNCEWNIPLTLMICSIMLLISFILAYYVFKHILYYLCCCCLCVKNQSKDKNRDYKKLRNRYVRSFSRTSNIDDSDECDMSNNEKEYSESHKLMKTNSAHKSRNVPNSVGKFQKYSLLKNDETLGYKSDKNKNTALNQLLDEKSRLGAQLNYDEDEDVIFEHKMSPTMLKSTKDDKFVKKYNLI